MHLKLFTALSLLGLVCSSLVAQPFPRRGELIASTAGETEPAILPLGDLDGDAKDDFLIVTGRLVGNIGIEARTGDTGTVLWSIPDLPLASRFLGHRPSWLRIEDLDQDGASEFVVITHSGIEVRSGRTGQLRPGTRVAAPLGHPSSLLEALIAPATDRNGDGVAEVVVQARVNTQLAFAIYDPATGAIVTTTRNKPNVAGKALRLLDDLDGDQIPDYGYGTATEQVQGRFIGSIRLLSGRSGAQIGQLSNFSTNNGFGQEFEVYADVTGDGIREVAVALRGTETIPGRVVLMDPVTGVTVAEAFSSRPSTILPKVIVVRSSSPLPQVFSAVPPDSNSAAASTIVAEHMEFGLVVTNPPVAPIRAPHQFEADSTSFAIPTWAAIDFQCAGDLDGNGTVDFLMTHRSASGTSNPIIAYRTPGITPYGSNSYPPLNPATPSFIFGNPEVGVFVYAQWITRPAASWLLIGPDRIQQPTLAGDLLVDPSSAVLLDTVQRPAWTFLPQNSWQGSTLNIQLIWLDPTTSSLVLGPAHSVLF